MDQVLPQRSGHAGKLRSPLASRKPRGFSLSREGDIARGLPITPRQSRITISELLEHVKDDYQVNRKKTYRDLEARCRLHLLPFFGNYRACNLTTDEVRAYIRKRQTEGATNASINRELAALKRAFTLASKLASSSGGHTFPCFKRTMSARDSLSFRSSSKF